MTTAESSVQGFVLSKGPTLFGEKPATEIVDLALPRFQFKTQEDFERFYLIFDWLIYEGFVVEVDSRNNIFEFSKDGRQQIALRYEYIARADK